ncbi:MAG TPA: putative quinol monooxygenase [Streptosporangiaceae bacterium]|jgi:quinol monooxygenase YgiN
MAYVVIATWRAKPGRAEHVKNILDTVTPINRAEEKTLEFQAHVSSDDPNTFVLYEKYVDASGYQDHKNTENFQTYVLDDAIPNLESRNVLTAETLD